MLLSERPPAQRRRRARIRKVDGLRHRNSGTEMALRGWQKRVRFAAARGEAAALGALRVKLLQSSKKLGLRRAKLASYSEYDHSDSLGI